MYQHYWCWQHINECLKYFLRGLFCKIVVDKVQTFCQRIKLKMFSSGNEFSGQLFVRCSPIALAPPPSTPLLTKLYIFRPTWINLEAEIHVWKYRSKLTTKYEISCWRNMVAHQYKLAWKEETFVNLVPINERHKIAFKNTFSWLVWLQECEENMGIQQMLSSWKRKKLEWKSG